MILTSTHNTGFREETKKLAMQRLLLSGPLVLFSLQKDLIDMRKVEEIGTQFKRTGFLRGTAMWKWRNIIIGSIVGCVLLVDGGVIYYSLEKNKEKARQDQSNGDKTDPITAKLNELQSRKAELRHSLTDAVPASKDIPVSVSK